MRASDADRSRVVARLRWAHAVGAVGLETLEWRLDRAQRSLTVGGLRALVADLPARHPRDRVRQALARLWAGAAELPPAPGSVRYMALPAARQSSVLVGRSRRCSVRLDDESVSRVHCEITRTDAGWRLRDLDSTNGTFIEGARVRDCALAPGEVVTLGGTSLCVTYPPW